MQEELYAEHAEQKFHGVGSICLGVIKTANLKNAVSKRTLSKIELLILWGSSLEDCNLKISCDIDLKF